MCENVSTMNRDIVGVHCTLLQNKAKPSGARKAIRSPSFLIGAGGMGKPHFLFFHQPDPSPAC